MVLGFKQSSPCHYDPALFARHEQHGWRCARLLAVCWKLHLGSRRLRGSRVNFERKRWPLCDGQVSKSCEANYVSNGCSRVASCKSAFKTSRLALRSRFLCHCSGWRKPDIEGSTERGKTCLPSHKTKREALKCRRQPL